MEVKLVKPNLEMKAEIIEAIDDFKQSVEVIKNGIQGAPGILSFDNVEEWIAFAQKGTGEPGWVPYRQYIAVNKNNEVIGFINLRLELNDHLINFGGHIGYGVCPKFRKRGAATEMLKQTLKIAKKEGINEILITCADTNLASEKVILNNGGVYEDSRKSDDGVTKRFWIKYNFHFSYNFNFFKITK